MDKLGKKIFLILCILSLFLPLSIIYSFNYINSLPEYGGRTVVYEGYSFQIYESGGINNNFVSKNISLALFQELFFSRNGVLALWRALYSAIIPFFIYFFFMGYFPRSRWSHFFLFFGFCILSFYYTFYIFLLLYRFITHSSFDFNFFWYNRDVAYETIMKTYKYSVASLIVFCLSLPILWWNGFKNFFHSTTKETLKKYLFLVVFVLIVNIATLFAPPLRAKGEIMGFLEETFLKNHKIIDFYNNLYWENFDRILEKKFSFTPSVNPSAFGENIFVLELESLSSLIMSEKVTPQYLSAVKQGVYFPFFYTTSVQTIRGQESLLCGLPPTSRLTLVSSRTITQLEQIPCLPRLLKQLGFRTIFFKSDDLGFANSDKFMSAIGFDELHWKDIMKPGDPELPWGYREDIFFERIFDHLKRYKGQKIFVFIAVSSSNHWPFQVYDERYLHFLPFPSPKNSAEQLSNATFVQDKYLEKFFSYYNREYSRNTSLFLTSDQSWPIHLHPNNVFNEVGAYEENFLIPLTFIPPRNAREKFYFSKAVSERFSQTDILPTIVRIFDAKNAYPFIGESFEYELIVGQARLSAQAQTKISVQPYNGGFISLVRYPEKYLFSVPENMVEKFDLLQDPTEQSPLWNKNADQYLPYISEYFTSGLKKPAT